MPESVVVDASTLIALEKIGLLELLCKLYKQIVLPDAVVAEFGPVHLDCSTITKVESRFVKLFTDDLNLGKGESEVIAFALASDMTAIIDDEKARKTAKTLGLTVTGTIGILLKAEELGLIESARSKAQELKEKGFYLSADLLNKIGDFKRR